MKLIFDLKLRIPGWTGNEVMASDLYHFEYKASDKVSIRVDGTVEAASMENGCVVSGRIRH